MLALAEVFALTRQNGPHTFNAEQMLWALSDCFVEQFGAPSSMTVVNYGPTSRSVLSKFVGISQRSGMHSVVSLGENESEGNGALLRNAFSFSGADGDEAEQIGYQQARLTHFGTTQAQAAAIHARIGWSFVHGVTDLSKILQEVKI